MYNISKITLYLSSNTEIITTLCKKNITKLAKDLRESLELREH